MALRLLRNSLSAARRATPAILLAVLLSGCTNLFFQPQTTLFDSPDRYGIKYQVEQLRAADGTRLTAWYFPARQAPGGGAAKGTILFLHGNGENISTHFRSIAWLPAEGYNVLGLDYRGYGTSEGAPSLPGAEADIDAAMKSLLDHPGVDPHRIVIFGQSLGGALAIYYAAHTSYRANIRAVVIDSAFYDYRRIAREKLAGTKLTWAFQWLPWLVIDDDYSPRDAVAGISPLPLLLIQGDSDRVVPPHNINDLFARAREPKQMWVVPGADHLQALQSADLRKKLVEYLDRHVSDAPAQ